MNQEFIERLRTAIQIKTYWPGNAKVGDAEAEKPLVDFQNFLKKAYPSFHKAAERWVLSPYSIVYRWPRKDARKDAGKDLDKNSGKGKDAGKESKPAAALLLGHYDVVPVETAKWTVGPFDADLKDNYIYGRGALDMKGTLLSIFESLETLCREDFKPKEDVWIALGGDEERSGIRGATETAKWFAEKGVRFSFVLDEGTSITSDQFKVVKKPLALVGIEEKGYLSLELSVEQSPGHSSQPPEKQAVAILSSALIRISKKPFPWVLTPAVEAFFKQLATHTTGFNSFVMKNARLLGPLFFKIMAVTPANRALFRNTIAMTMMEGSAAENVMPSTVKAVMNLRLLPPWTVESSIKRIKAVVNDKRVNVNVRGLGSNPTKTGPGQETLNSPGWKEILNALESSFPGVPALPYLMTATTDSRHYKELSKYIFRFFPQLLGAEDMALIHGHDERISYDNLDHSLKFYTALLKQF